MRFNIVFPFMLFCAIDLFGQSQVVNLLPVPSSISIKSGQLHVNGVLRIQIIGPEKDELLQKAVTRLGEKIRKIC